MLGSWRAAYHDAVRIHHLALRTANVPRLEAFYRDVVGLAPARDDRGESAESVWLLAGETRVMLERLGPGEPMTPEGSMELTAFAILTTERAAFEERLARSGIPVEQRTDFTLYFRDPDGRRVGVSHYPDGAPG
jgi:catechol 2,3-dioxygenase-like lactoylglutathione lyase family enzyme